MKQHDRREFLADVGRGMLVASVGAAVASDLGLAPAWAAEEGGALLFGDLEPLAALMEETTPDKLLPAVVAKINGGTNLRTVVAAAALANARTFGGEDYTGFHAFMALAPAYEMAKEMPAEQRALPILKVLYRNTDRIQDVGGRSHEVLHAIEPADLPAGKDGGEAIRAATRKGKTAEGERILAAVTARSVEEAFNDIQLAVQDDINVHRVVLAWRAWDVLDLTGKAHALTLLRQSVHFCVDSEKSILSGRRARPGVRAALPKLLDHYKLLGKPLGKRKAEDKWVAEMADLIRTSDREKAADAVAAALAEGISPEDVGEAISLAANQLVLRDPGRTRAEEGKPVGSVHGASVGVHASDSANAWRNIVRVSNHRNKVASLIVGAYHTAGQSRWASQKPYPWEEHLAKVKEKDAKKLLARLEDCIKHRDQPGACAAAQRYGELGHPERGMFDLLLRYAVSEDGALHAEKYYRTVSEEFRATRPAFRLGHLVGLARVTASAYGFAAPGYKEACGLLRKDEG
jgi:hypothetical protein